MVGDPTFTLKIISPDGSVYYELPSEALQDPKPVDELMQQLVAMRIDMAHTPYGPTVELLGTFIINLSTYYPRE